MIEPNEKPNVILVGNDGNAFVIIGRVAGALRKAGTDKEYVDQYMAEAMAGDYDNLLAITMEYVNVQ